MDTGIIPYKTSIASVLLLLCLLCSCKKSKLDLVIDQMVGTYQTIRICETDSGGLPRAYDTTRNVIITVTKGDYSTIVIGNYRLDFVGNLDTKNYEFALSYGPLVGQYSAKIDENFHHFVFGEYKGIPPPNRTGVECNYYGDK